VFVLTAIGSILPTTTDPQSSDLNVPIDEREALIITLLNAERRAEATMFLIVWRAIAKSRQDDLMVAWCCEHLANIMMLHQTPHLALQLLEQSLQLRQRTQDLRGVARLSWSIGNCLIALGRLDAARLALLRSKALAEELGMDKVTLYRDRLQRLSERS
jgi:hypothetical protein